MSEPTPAALPSPGHYQGEGSWYDETSDSQGYRIDMRFEESPRPEPEATVRALYRSNE